jgi:hypothetical protein
VPKKPPQLELPPAIGDEIRDVARRAQRSVAFVVQRTLVAGKDAPVTAVSGPTAPLALTTDDEDPPNLLTKLKAVTAADIVSAWPVAREKFHAWLKKLEDAAQAERADDLDAELAHASDPATLAPRLAELSKSEYPKVRALVAAHANVTPAVLELLAKDRERSVREAASARA